MGVNNRPVGMQGSKQSVCVFVCTVVKVCIRGFLYAVCLGVLIRCGLIKSVLEKEEQTEVIEKHKGT